MKMFPEFTVEDFQFLKSEYDIGVMLTELARVQEAIALSKEQFVCNALERPYSFSGVPMPTCIQPLLDAIDKKLGQLTLDGYIADNHGGEYLGSADMVHIRMEWLHNIKGAVYDRKNQLEAEYA